jgi:hypothetical protein
MATCVFSEFVKYRYKSRVVEAVEIAETHREK